MAQLPLGLRSIPCGIGLGTNVGRRIDNLIQAARAVLARVPDARLTAAGGVYETAPVDCPVGSESFLNTVIEIETDAGAHVIHQVLKEIELDMGRPTIRERNAPRSIDLDILYLGDRVIEEPGLSVPHPRLHLRRFVLRPLADIRPELTLPIHRRTVKELLESLEDDPAQVVLVRRDWLHSPV